MSEYSDAHWWDELAVAALLGTDRRPITEFAFMPGKLGTTAARLTGDQAAVLLDAAALAVGYRRGGVTAGRAMTEPDRAPADGLPRAGRKAAARLIDLLQGADLELLMFWCSTAAEMGRLAPPECLPDLLDLGVKQPVLRPAVAPVLGERGRWLARQQPAWTKAFPAVVNPADSATDPAEAKPIDPQIWYLGTPVQRASWLRAIRRVDPAAGVAALAATWAKESGPHRAGFLPLLSEGLGPADEALLETALDDRRADVRQVAADLLAALQTSDYADRMRSRAKRFVHPERVMLRTKLVIDVPDRLDPAAVRDGLTDSRPGTRMTAESRSQWWLEQVIAATPLSAWSQLFDTPEAAIGHHFDEPWHQAIQAGWAWAAFRQRNVDWAVALLGTRSRYRVEELLSLLDGEVLVTALRRRLAHLGPAEVQLLGRYLDVCPSPWPPEVAADVLAWLQPRMPQLHPRSAQPVLNLMSYRFPIEAGPAVIAAADDLPLDDLWRSALRSVARLISVRTRIYEELQ
ncbi:MAG TPA: DUF5691 domain-containing protein [Kineosporiaceae bacterium]|nr:DUF5691 domain-containing protein [Kineosporiaceae bacterium]